MVFSNQHQPCPSTIISVVAQPFKMEELTVESAGPSLIHYSVGKERQSSVHRDLSWQCLHTFCSFLKTDRTWKVMRHIKCPLEGSNYCFDFVFPFWVLFLNSLYRECSEYLSTAQWLKVVHKEVAHASLTWKTPSTSSCTVDCISHNKGH